MTIDWNGNLEAVHADGRVVAVRLDLVDRNLGLSMTHRVDPEPESGICWFNEDGSHRRGGWSIRNVVEEKKEDGMTTFKVGDRVRSRSDADWHDEWPEATVIGVGGAYPRIRRDDGREGDACDGWWELVEQRATDELAELRAWKDAAIARYPALAEPESDEDAALRFYEEWDNGDDSFLDMMPRMFAWARANPR